MKNILNIKNINKALAKKGFNQADIARNLEVTRATVSLWFKNDKFPRSKKLLQLGRSLDLQFEDLVISDFDDSAPIVAFRKKGKRIAKGNHFEAAQQMGKLLDQLSSELPQDAYFEKTTLRSPKNEYRYIQSYATKIREEIGVGPVDQVKFEGIIQKFLDLNVILIPVLWGPKENEENALCIYLPSSNTTWVYLNIDAKIHDFKFWMAHELAHVLISFDHSKESETFMDAFAQALLFPETCAKEAHKKLCRFRNNVSRLNKVFEIAEEYIINPYTVLKSVNSYAKENGLTIFKPDKAFFRKWHHRNNSYKSVTQILTKSTDPAPGDYIDLSKKAFGSPFFDLLKSYISKHDVSSGFIHNILNTSILDAKSIYQELN